MVYPDVDLENINSAIDKFGFNPVSPQLKLMIARAVNVAEGHYDADAVFIASCFRCAEAALVRTELRKYIQEHTRLPVVTYSFTERTKSAQMLTRMEALVTIVERKELLARERQVGLTAGIDSGSSTTKAMIMRDNEIIGKYWLPTQDVFSLGRDGAGRTRWTRRASNGSSWRPSAPPDTAGSPWARSSTPSWCRRS